MKNIYQIALGLIFALLLGCQEEEPQLETLVVPTDLNVSSIISTDGSGIVQFSASANNAITYQYQFSDGTSSESVPSGAYTKRFTQVGLNSYLVTVVAYGTGGLSSSVSVEIEVQSDFSDDEAIQFLTGGASKTWYLAASEPGHLGVGGTPEIAPDSFWFPAFFSAAPFEKCNDEISDCLCDDELTFSLNGNNQLTYQLNNNGQTFFNVGHAGAIGQTASEDTCFDFDTSGTSIVSLAPSDAGLPEAETRGTVMNFSNDAFMGYFVSSSSYEILSITENTLYVRTLDGLNPVLAWYHKFSTSPPDQDPGTSFNNLVWSDDFNTDGAPDPANWAYDLGAGGWGNNEAQTYTNNAENVKLENGMLKITAKANGGGYTSARIKTENLFEFTYGRVEVRAKLPSAGGTWPAIWTLGANFDTVGWPTCGEMDIMEHVGNNVNTIISALHFPGNSGGNALVGTANLSTATTDFHTYSVEWTANEIKFFIDDNPVHHQYTNTANPPYNSDFFLILNIAMGGTLGGAIDPGFTEDTMEIDYVRVYQ